MTEPHSIHSAIQLYLESVSGARSPNTARTYHNALQVFCTVLEDHGLLPDHSPPTDLLEDAIAWFASGLRPTRLPQSVCI